MIGFIQEERVYLLSSKCGYLTAGEKWYFKKQIYFPMTQQQAGTESIKAPVLNADVYTYIIDIVCENSQILTYKGNITLIQ